ncbi:hypothetical protein ACIOJD_04055 [Streptomyces sp. NPDC088116]|uniref:hypothetical protein n=1 Tax=Streptomyces sp. NPDC088116 TaxID=3365825 RepID=UPI00382CA5F4
MTTRVAAGLGTRLLDRALVTAAARAGAPGRIRFTERQLYYELCRVLRRPLRAVPRGIPFLPARLSLPDLPVPLVRYERYEEALRRHGDVAGLLAAVPEPREPQESRQPSEPDLYDYGLPRLLVCQSRSVARMLLANDVHLEAACPVFAADDLPLDARLLTGLGRVEGATVHVLHDASVEGIALTARVRAEVSRAVAVSGAPTAPGMRVTSMGLVPRHATALRLLSRRGPARDLGAAGLPAGLGRHELDWLAQGRFAEVESVPPDRLLRAVLRLVRGPRMSGHSAWSGLRELRTAGFMTWPTN